MNGRPNNQGGIAIAGLLASACLWSGCGLLNKVTSAPGDIVSSVKGEEEPVDPKVAHNLAQQNLMRFADVCAAEITQATREFAERVNTREGRAQALQWKIEYCNHVWRLASAPEPYQRTFDVIIVISLLRLTHEGRYTKLWGDADQPMLDSLRRLEAAAWVVAAQSFHPQQVELARAVIDKWLAGDPASRTSNIAELPGFVELASNTEEGGKFGQLLSIDPMSGLEPAMREMAQAREMGERAVYYLQRVPELLISRVELFTQRTLQEPELSSTVDSIAKVSSAADSLAQTAAKLPQVIDEQRAGLIRDLETSRAPLTEILDNSRRTLEAGNALTGSLTELVRTVDTTLARFESKEEPGTAPPEPAGPPPEPGRPFDIREYTAAAEQLTATIHSLDEAMPVVQKTVDEVATRSERSIDHVFVRALEFLVAVLVGGALTVLAVRRISARWKRA